MKNLFKIGKRRPGKNRESLSKDDWPAGLTILDEKNFNEFIEKYPLSLVDFYSPTCGPCVALSRTIRQVSRQYKHRVAFGKVNIAQHRELAKRYKVMSIPYLVIFSYGKKVYTLMGKKSEREITKVLDKILSESED